jgi:hypothetical protein
LVFPLIPEPSRLRVIPESAATTPWSKWPEVPTSATACKKSWAEFLAVPTAVGNDPFPPTFTTKRLFPSTLQVLMVDEGRIERCLETAPKGRACLPHVDGIRQRWTTRRRPILMTASA